MADKTGFEKFMSKQVGEAVQIRPKSNTAPVAKTPAQAGEGSAALEVKAKHPGGRPRKDRSEEPKLVTLNFQIDEGLKQILENLKYRTHKSTVKGVVLEAIDLLLDKYGIEK